MKPFFSFVYFCTFPPGDTIVVKVDLEASRSDLKLQIYPRQMPLRVDPSLHNFNSQPHPHPHHFALKSFEFGAQDSY